MAPPTKITYPNIYKVSQDGGNIQFGIDQITVKTKKGENVSVSVDWMAKNGLDKVVMGEPHQTPKKKPANKTVVEGKLIEIIEKEVLLRPFKQVDPRTSYLEMIQKFERPKASYIFYDYFERKLPTDPKELERLLNPKK